MKTPPPPEGFIFASEGPLAHPSTEPTNDILWYYHLNGWIDCKWSGNGSGPWAVREGSPVAIANGLSPAPPAAPDPALAAFNALAAQLNAKLDALNARLDRMEARAAEMESTTDPTMQDLPWNPEWPDPPPLPERKTRWVNRGCGFYPYVPTGNRIVYFLTTNKNWSQTFLFSHTKLHHIEAV
jgi:hypothetical protein